MIGLFEVACCICLLSILLYRYGSSNFNFWKDRGINGPKPILFFGNMLDVFLGKISMGYWARDMHTKYENEQVVGFFAGMKPILLIRDSDMIKSVLIKDFTNFAERAIPVDRKRDPLATNLFAIEAKRWRPLRAKLSPIFTTGKLKDMCLVIVECAIQLEEYLKVLVKENEPIEVRELTAKYTTDVIGRCAFGIDMKSLSEGGGEFRRMGRKIFNPNFIEALVFSISQVNETLTNYLSRFTGSQKMANFITPIILDTIEYRKKNNIVVNDFINVLMELRDHPETIEIEVNDKLLVAQAFIFFAAGFETSSTTMTNALYELAINQDIQDKLRVELKEAEEKYKGDLRYENIKELKYLDQVFKETLRKYPPAQVLMRQAEEPYTFKDANLTIAAKQAVWISIHGMHYDPSIYPNPDVFDPERFTPEAEATRQTVQYMPFGEGPRNCIAARFAGYQTKIGLLKILQNFKVDVCEQTKIPYEYRVRSFILAPKDGVPLKFSALTETQVET